MKAKSILDGVKVEDKAFPLSKHKEMKHGEQPMDVVSSCPHCGAPIYGLKWIVTADIAPPIKYTCICHQEHKHKDLKDIMCTK